VRHPEPRRGCTWTTSSSTRCAAAPPPGPVSGSICATFPRASAPPGNRPNPTTIPGRPRGLRGVGRGRRRRVPARRRA
jgi:hypothetical protein